MTDDDKKGIATVEKMLKPFQKRTVKYVVKELNSKTGLNKVLIADEVGLGKTIVAKGVIANMLKNDKISKPLHVVYICNNAVLADQNIKKLSPVSRSVKSVGRLCYLAYEPAKTKKESPLVLSSLTPNTSLKLSNSTGNQHERAILYSLLLKYTFFQEYHLILSKILIGNKSIVNKNWKDLLKKYETKPLRSDLPKKIKNELEKIDYFSEKFPKMATILPHKEYKNFFKAFQAFIRAANRNNIKKFDLFWYEVIRVLRTALAKSCIDYLQADLFVLDEFQRFKVLLDKEDDSEAGEIAQRILQNEEAKVLLLSATPFKPYTTRVEEMLGENHESELKRIVKYLGGDNGNKLWNKFSKQQQAFFKILKEPLEAIHNIDAAANVKNDLEKLFKKFMSRNERISIAATHDNMVKTNFSDAHNVSTEDIHNFIALDQVVKSLQEDSATLSKNFGSTVEFAKSAPYSLSYLYGYNIYKKLFDSKDAKEKHLSGPKTKLAFLDKEKINAYKAVGFYKNKPSYPNLKLRMLAEELFKNKAELLLWMPATQTYYKPNGVFKDNKDFSKILIFSSWVMAPRAISTLISYEVERRTTAKDNNAEQKYFDAKKRIVTKIAFGQNDKGKPKDMRNLALLYPSKTLINNGNLFVDIKSLDEKLISVKAQIKNRLKDLFKTFDLKNTYVKKKSKDNDWYWLAPALLDYHADCFDDFIVKITSITNGQEKKHYDFLNSTIQKLISGKKKMGKFPPDLFDVLAKMAMASPANAALFALHKTYVNELWISKQIQAFKIAKAYRSLFNKPESVSAVNLCISKVSIYWKQVIEYALQGNIAAMMEEYFYMLKDSESVELFNEKDDDISSIVVEAITINPSNIDVVMKHKDNDYRTERMRSHFAMSFGNNKAETEKNESRSINVRSSFNSPFKPFVLASTSIGQEGLDFHYYCRKLFHWNLPHNAIDIEQREGRINRFKSFVIRKKIMELVSKEELLAQIQKNETSSIWQAIFQLMEAKNKDVSNGLKPFWYLDEGETKIERFIPIHEFSRDAYIFDQLKSTLALYRLTFGQPRQEELVEAFKNVDLEDKQLNLIRKRLLLNLGTLE